ncbi:AAA family ATPase [Vibrio sp. CUB2]|uniref:ATP-dependent nuclease n=1 Tax=Vibrio sp. CUB2 TaxID=2315233 RepID=UPI000769BC14|nr:AAA family ATPase [Vibrio sp. CUB2]
MEIIKSIQIRKFRSLKSVTKQLNVSDLNIFVGQNDQGKSNVLRALNLFFNDQTDLGSKFRFNEDYCFHSNKGKGTRHEVRIDLFIDPPKHRFKHAKPLQWTKKWKQDGSVVEQRKYVETGKDLSQKDNVYKWLDKIRYRYIPAVKGQDYFSSLMGELHDVLNEAHEDILNSQGEDFITGIQEITSDITRDLNSQIGIENTIQVPSDFRQLFSNLDFGVKLNGNTYHLKQRGDGIKIRHIPIILKYMSDREKNISRNGYVKPDTIWGFEEPENNLELKYAFDLAEEFRTYSKDIQIFLTTHSPAFYALDKTDEDGVTTFFISQGSDECTSVKKVTHDDTEEIHSTMGLLPLITPYLSEIYEQQKEIAKLKEDIAAIKPDIEHVILTEDTDIQSLKVLMATNGCNVEKTEFVSYLGAGQVGAAITIGKYIRDKMPEVNILIHRDRDYLEDHAISNIKAKVTKNQMQFYVPDGVDVESEYLCPHHINSLWPVLGIEKIEELIAEATTDSEEDSVDRLIEESYKTGKFTKDGNAKRVRRLQAQYKSNKKRFRYGKKVAGVLSSKLQKELKRNANIYQPSEFIKKEELLEFFSS